MKADQLRDKFLNFFKSKKHTIVESDSLVPKDDPTVLFTPAGMNQFKKEFLGQITDFTRAASSQRCMRTDDLEKVGKTAAHHTFFEMLGNFSFGDYFKKEAITWAWEFLTQELKIDKDKLWVSVYKDDAEAYQAWRDTIKVPESKIVKLGDKDNFWPAEAKEKGPNGPCGPCSEIFFDFGIERGCKKHDCNPACSCGRFVEIWNLVFTQFNRRDGGKLEPLPNKNIDTGMGLERLAAVMQGVYSNFETDLFVPIIKEISARCKSKGNGQEDFIYAIADHVRAIVFCIYDGVLPSNEDRGYIVRKLIRRSALHLRTLGIKPPFLYTLVPLVAQAMQKPYPALDSRRENIAEAILAEEKSFMATLKTSDTLFGEKFSALLNKEDPRKAGEISFQLYDTYGIPLELSRDWLDKHKIKFSQEAFDKELESQKNRSKAQSAMKGDVFSAQDLESGVKKTKFLGYLKFASKSKVLKIIKDAQPVKKIIQDEEATIILDQSPFYPESGGQVGDTGELVKGKNIFSVLNTKKSGKVILHIGKVKQGSFKSTDILSAQIDLGRRMNIARNHTATHLLQAALRKVLGVHVQQQGSLVAEDRLRFDFTHFKDIKPEALRRIEEIVNEYILDNLTLWKREMTLAVAKKSGALAFFGDKYEAKVRVVSIGDVSKEFCGGTHLDATGQIGIFKIIQEGSVASGVRRIEALTGKMAYKAIEEKETAVDNIASLLGVPAEKIIPELEKRLSRLKELEKELSLKRLDTVKVSLDSFIQGAEEINGVRVIARVVENADIDLLRKTLDLIKAKESQAVIALGASINGRALLVLGVSGDLSQKGIDAVALIRDIVVVIGGSGGGRKDFAQAGGNNPAAFGAAFEKLKEIIRGIQL